ncbi:hypothetical protein V8C86DRAFT_1697656 [Haematococcus lacustris]
MQAHAAEVHALQHAIQVKSQVQRLALQQATSLLSDLPHGSSLQQSTANSLVHSLPAPRQQFGDATEYVRRRCPLTGRTQHLRCRRLAPWPAHPQTKDWALQAGPMLEEVVVLEESEAAEQAAQPASSTHRLLPAAQSPPSPPALQQGLNPSPHPDLPPHSTPSQPGTPPAPIQVGPGHRLLSFTPSPDFSCFAYTTTTSTTTTATSTSTSTTKDPPAGAGAGAAAGSAARSGAGQTASGEELHLVCAITLRPLITPIQGILGPPAWALVPDPDPPPSPLHVADTAQDPVAGSASHPRAAGPQVPLHSLLATPPGFEPGSAAAPDPGRARLRLYFVTRGGFGLSAVTLGSGIDRGGSSNHGSSTSTSRSQDQGPTVVQLPWAMAARPPGGTREGLLGDVQGLASSAAGHVLIRQQECELEGGLPDYPMQLSHIRVTPASVTGPGSSPLVATPAAAATTPSPPPPLLLLLLLSRDYNDQVAAAWLLPGLSPGPAAPAAAVEAAPAAAATPTLTPTLTLPAAPAASLAAASPAAAAQQWK